MKKLKIKFVFKSNTYSFAGCGRNWDNVCGRRD